MGYYTNFSLKVIPESKLENVQKSIEEHLKYSPFDCEVKWYTAKQDILTISNIHPNTLISLYGDGEEQGDRWVFHAMNGDSVFHSQPQWEPPGPSDAWIKIAKRTT